VGFSSLSIARILPVIPADTVFERTNVRVRGAKKRDTGEKGERQEKIKADR
jgi:hypothetical protein